MRRRPKPEAPPTGTILGLVPENRRRFLRCPLRNLAYVQVDGNGVGVLRDISEGGIATQAVSRLTKEQHVTLQIDLPSPKLHLEAQGRVAWTDSSGQSGLEFVNLSLARRASLKEWILTQVLADAQRTAGNLVDDLLFSQSARPAIRLESPRLKATRIESRADSAVRLLWFSLRSRSFARIVDSLAIICAVLLFSIVALMMTDTLPSWYLATPLLFAVGVVFWGLYWFIFSFWFGTTPGHHLAELARVDAWRRAESREEDQMRFR